MPELFECGLGQCAIPLMMFLALPKSERALISKIRAAAGARQSDIFRSKSIAKKRQVGDRNWRRLRRAAPSRRSRPAYHHRFQPGKCSLPASTGIRAESVGHRCLARGLSDIAAMGGDPTAAFLSLALPAKLPQSWVDGFIKGVLKLAHESGISLAGGDTAQSPSGVLADIIVLGSVPRGTAVLRSGRSSGRSNLCDRITRRSRSGAELIVCKTEAGAQPVSKAFFPAAKNCVRDEFLREKKLASSMIDISDGLSTDLSHICEESNVGAEIWAKCDTARDHRQALRSRWHCSLRCTAATNMSCYLPRRPNRHVPSTISGIPITCIGEIIRSRKIFLIDSPGKNRVLRPSGWEHFRHQ